jgi:hypothetical protein
MAFFIMMPIEIRRLENRGVATDPDSATPVVVAADGAAAAAAAEVEVLFPAAEAIVGEAFDAAQVIPVVPADAFVEEEDLSTKVGLG